MEKALNNSSSLTYSSLSSFSSSSLRNLLVSEKANNGSQFTIRSKDSGKDFTYSISRHVFNGKWYTTVYVEKEYMNFVKLGIYFNGKIYNKKTGHFEDKSVKEETSFEVKIEGLPMMFMSDMGPGQLKQKLRKIVKQPSMISSVKRVTDADVKKTFRLKAQGRDEEENEVDESSYDKINKYYDAAKKNKDRATNSAVATILRKGDHSKDLNTMRKREKGIKLAKSRITDKIRKGQKT